MTMSAEPSGRLEFLKQSAVAVAGLTAFSQSASAAKYFGDDKDLYPEVVRPSSAVRDSSKLTSSEVQGKITKIKEFLATGEELVATLSKDGQADVRPAIRKGFDSAKLRDALYGVSNEVFDEETQRGTDRIIRIIVQDAVEFEEASRQKPGVPRSTRRVGILKKKAEKIVAALKDFLEFTK